MTNTGKLVTSIPGNIFLLICWRVALKQYNETKNALLTRAQVLKFLVNRYSSNVEDSACHYVSKTCYSFVTNNKLLPILNKSIRKIGKQRETSDF